MKIAELNGKKVCVLGYGCEGQATVRALEKYAPDADITIADANAELITNNHKQITGPSYLKALSDFDIIIKTPGIPPQPEFDAVQNKLTNATQIFLDTIADSGAVVIGVTGSKGKSTTSSLIAAILKAAGKDVHLVGNIGVPTLDFLERAKKNTYFVQEMSSYQLMNLTVSPSIVVVTSFFPEHLDYHGTIEAYKEAKKHIARFQTKNDVVFYDASSPGAKEIAEESPGTHLPFSENDAPVALEETHLIGAHNRRNIAAAAKVAEYLSIPDETTIAAVTAFHGLPHRLQSLGIHHGIEWIDDAISTTPESTIAAIDALGDRVKTVILGGQDRGNDFAELAKRIDASGIETVILFPGSGPRIRVALQSQCKRSINIHDVSDMASAVLIAKKTRNQKLETRNLSAIVLLSTASPSYNMFKNFEEKGDSFARCIREA